MIVRNEEDAVYFAKTIKEPILPIFFISNVTGKNLNLFKKFLQVLPLEKNTNLSKNGFEKSFWRRIQNQSGSSVHLGKPS